MRMCPTVFSLLFSNISSNNDHYISLIREVSYDSSPDTHQKYTRNCAHSLLKVCPSFSSPAFSGRAFSVAPNVSFTRRRGVGIVFNCLGDCLSVCLSVCPLSRFPSLPLSPPWKQCSEYDTLLVLQRLGLARVTVDFLSLSLVTFRTLFHFRVSTYTKQGITPWSARRYAPRR